MRHVVGSSLALRFRVGPGSWYGFSAPTGPTSALSVLTRSIVATASSSLKSKTKMYLDFFFFGAALILVERTESSLLRMIGSSFVALEKTTRQ